MPSNPQTGHILWENYNSKGHMYPNAHYSTIYNSQDMGAIKMSIKKWMDKEVCYIYMKEYYSAIKENEFKPIELRWMNLEPFIQSSIPFSSVAQLCLTLCDPMDCSKPDLPVHHQLQEFAQTHVHWVSDAIQLSHPLSSASPPAFNFSQHQGVSSSHQVAKELEFQLQHQSFQWLFRTDSL